MSFSDCFTPFSDQLFRSFASAFQTLFWIVFKLAMPWWVLFPSFLFGFCCFCACPLLWCVLFPLWPWTYAIKGWGLALLELQCFPNLSLVIRQHMLHIPMWVLILVLSVKSYDDITGSPVGISCCYDYCNPSLDSSSPISFPSFKNEINHWKPAVINRCNPSLDTNDTMCFLKFLVVVVFSTIHRCYQPLEASCSCFLVDSCLSCWMFGTCNTTLAESTSSNSHGQVHAVSACKCTSGRQTDFLMSSHSTFLQPRPSHVTTIQQFLLPYNRLLPLAAVWGLKKKSV